MVQANTLCARGLQLTVTLLTLCTWRVNERPGLFRVPSDSARLSSTQSSAAATHSAPPVSQHSSRVAVYTGSYQTLTAEPPRLHLHNAKVRRPLTAARIITVHSPSASCLHLHNAKIRRPLTAAQITVHSPSASCLHLHNAEIRRPLTAAYGYQGEYYLYQMRTVY